MTTAIYPGSFDPITHGHVSIVRSGLVCFDKLVVAVLENPRKKALFPVDTRVVVLEKAIRDEGIDPSQATVVSFDLSGAVDVNFRENGAHPNLLIIQADLLHPPVRPRAFDRVFCFGVIQHTPDPKASFQSLVQLPRREGLIAIDCYRELSTRRWWTSYYRWRWLTTRMKPALVRALCRIWVTVSWPIVTTLWKLPGDGGRNLARYVFLIRDTFRRKRLDVTPKFEREWAVMQLVDQLTAHYDQPQTVAAVRTWFTDAQLDEVDVAPGDNGIVGRGRVPAASNPPPSR